MTINILKSKLTHVIIHLVHKVFIYPEIYDITFNVAIMAFKEINIRILSCYGLILHIKYL